jgi:hypothetical protein
MTRYLDKNTASQYLNLGKTIEIFLGRDPADNEIVSYLSFTKTPNTKIEIQKIDHCDEGDLDFVDIYSFSYADPDMTFETFYSDDIDSAISLLKSKFQLTDIKFVIAGLIQDEYLDLLKIESKT